MYSIKQQGDTVQTYVIEAVADTRADIASLPTTWAVGSTCLIIEDSSVWILGNNLIWQELDTAKDSTSGLKVLIVDALPTTNIDSHALYLVPMTTPTSKNTYYEYLYVKGAWELIGGDNQYVLPIASTTTLGGVKVDNKTITVDSTGTLTVLLDEVVETSTVLEDKITTTTQEVVNSSFSSISDEEISNLF